MTEIYINNTLIDLYEDSSMSLNFAIADIKTPDKRNTSYSKTIKVPGSKVNNKLFTHIYEISKESLTIGNGSNFSPDFNPNKKAKCIIYSDTLLQINGYVQLLKVNINGDLIEYEISVKGALGNLFSEVEGKKLTDLDFSEYDHLWNKAIQKLSWDTSIIKDGSPYVNFASGLPIGEGYVYPLIDYGRDDAQSVFEFEVKNLYPAIYTKAYIDKIFKYAGFTYTSAFFDSEFFKKLIIPFSGEVVKLSAAQIDARKFLANTVSDLDYSTNTYYDPTSHVYFAEIQATESTIIFSNDSIGMGFDNGMSYDPLTGIWTVTKKGTYDIIIDYDFDLTITPPVGTTDVRVYGQYFRGEIVHNLSNVLQARGVNVYFSSLPLVRNIVFPIRANGISLNVGDTIKGNLLFVSTMEFLNGTTSIDGTADYNISFNADTKFYNIPIVNPLIEGDTFLMNSAILKEVAMKDFFLSFVRMFNLMVTPDPNNEMNLLIEPQKDFYVGNTVVDWTSKLDLSKDIEIRPVSEIEGKQYRFSYKDDTDFYNAKYKDKYSLTYGEKTLNIDNDFVKGVKELDIIFSPTPSVGNEFDGKVIPRIVKEESNGSVSPFAGKPRLLIYGGVKSGVAWTYKSASGDTIETTYPYSGHLDDPFNPTVDILFSIPDEIYWGSPSDIGLTYTNNNTYNIYLKQFIEEITDKDSKIVIAYFYLKALDIFKLDFKNFIHASGINYRLNKIYDYDPEKDESTRVELAKIKRGVPFTATITGVDGTADDPRNYDLIDGGEDSTLRYKDIIDGGEDDNEFDIGIINA